MKNPVRQSTRFIELEGVDRTTRPPARLLGYALEIADTLPHL
jgi:hypothetical protein